jgi:hypothetical protein
LSVEQFQSALARQCIVRTGEDLACRSPVSRNGAPVERVAGLASGLAAGLAAELAVELAAGLAAELAEQLVVVVVHAAPVPVSMLIVSRVLLIEQP